MPLNWEISAQWESLDSGSPEERACFAALAIYAHDICLTEGNDRLANRLREAPFLSAYHLAEWIAWNWWRLRWEPRSFRDSKVDWPFAHRLSTIGNGYIWPNLSVFSDGQRVALVAKPTEERAKTPFRYIVDRAVIITSGEFEAGIDTFIEQVLERLDTTGVFDTNLEAVWRSVTEERTRPDLHLARKLEALLGADPDESDPKTIEKLQSDSKRVGTIATEELAAEFARQDRVLFVDDLEEIAGEHGYETSPLDSVRLSRGSEIPRVGEVAAWQLGARIARILREQEHLDGSRISDGLLAKMFGTTEAVLKDAKPRPNRGICFALDKNQTQGRVVLRSKWYGGRRFELARLLGERLVSPMSNRLFPATHTYTYRQKVQRSFAAEFLSPFDSVEEMLSGDYSNERQTDVADYFGVSALTIRTLLVNHGRIQREELEGDFESIVA